MQIDVETIYNLLIISIIRDYGIEKKKSSNKKQI
jgi:hypothetical protein